MSRLPHAPKTTLGIAVRTRRGAASLIATGGEIGLPYSTLSRVERGTHRPSADTAVKLARWLGWSVEQVLEAADQPAPLPDGAA